MRAYRTGKFDVMTVVTDTRLPDRAAAVLIQ